MDEQERERRAEIERKERAINERIDKERKESDEKDESLRSKITEEVGKLYNKIDKEKERLIDRIEKLEKDLESRDREIESESRDRDTLHDKTLTSLQEQHKNLEKALEIHCKNSRIHIKLKGLETIQAESLGGWRPDALPQPGVQQSQAIPSQQPPSSIQTDDEWARKGVPWWANPKWLTAVGGAIVAIITAVILALSHLKKDDHPKETPSKQPTEIRSNE